MKNTVNTKSRELRILKVFIWEHVTYEVKPGSRELVRYRDEYKYKTAYTHVSICYWDKYLKSEAWMEIVICVDAVK